MNKLAVVCILAACVVACIADYPTIGSRFCRDYRGRLVRPGQSYNDGCNTCTCGINGTPSFCTLRFCGPLSGSGGLVNPGGRLGSWPHGGRLGGIVNPIAY